MSKQFYFKRFSLEKSTQFSSIWPIDKTLSSATTSGQSGPGSNGNEGVLYIPQSSSIIGISLSDCLVPYPEHSLGRGSYPSAEKQLMYSTAPADWAKYQLGLWVENSESIGQLKSFQITWVNKRKKKQRQNKLQGERNCKSEKVCKVIQRRKIKVCVIVFEENFSERENKK